MDSIPQKRCAKCQQDFPATTEYFRANKAGKYGVCNPCKTCSRIEYAANHPKPPTVKGMKRCSKCHEWKSTDAFYASRKSGKLDSHCKVCRSLTRKAHRQEHKEFWQEYEQSHKERIRQASKKYRDSHKEQLTLDHQRYKSTSATYAERARASSKRWREKHPEQEKAARRQYEIARRHTPSRIQQRIAYRQKRRALKRNQGGSYTAQDVSRQFERQKGRCYYCKGKIAIGKGRCHIDHIVPLTRNGSNSPDNIVLACPTCNMRKYNRLPHEWPQGNRLL